MFRYRLACSLQPVSSIFSFFFLESHVSENTVETIQPRSLSGVTSAWAGLVWICVVIAIIALHIYTAREVTLLLAGTLILVLFGILLVKALTSKLSSKHLEGQLEYLNHLCVAQGLVINRLSDLPSEEELTKALKPLVSCFHYFSNPSLLGKHVSLQNKVIREVIYWELHQKREEEKEVYNNPKQDELARITAGDRIYNLNKLMAVFLPK